MISDRDLACVIVDALDGLENDHELRVELVARILGEARRVDTAAGLAFARADAASARARRSLTPKPAK